MEISPHLYDILQFEIHERRNLTTFVCGWIRLVEEGRVSEKYAFKKIRDYVPKRHEEIKQRLNERRKLL